MKKIKLFLTSTLNGLEQDIKTLGAFIGELNDRYEPYDTYFELITGDTSADSEKSAGKCDLFYIILHDEAPEKAISEFNIAYANFKNNNTPTITTYFKKTDQNAPGQSVLDFISRLDKELGHYYSYYANVDTLKLNIVLQLQSLGLVETQMEVKDSAIYMRNEKIVTLDNIPIILNNKQLAALKGELKRIEEEYWALREKIRKAPDDDDILMSFSLASAKKNKVSEAIRALENDIIQMEASFIEKADSGYISQRLKYARTCLEEGDLEGAKEALSADELTRDSERALELLENRKKEIAALVNDWLQRADILKLDITNQNRFTEIEEAYTKAISLEKEGGLNRKSLLTYADYLRGQTQYEKAIEYAEMSMHWFLSEKTDEQLLIDSYNLLGALYQPMQRFEDAEKMLLSSLRIMEARLAGDREKYESRYVSACNNIAPLYINTKRFTEAEALCRKGLSLLLNNKELRRLTKAENLLLAKLYSALATTVYMGAQQFDESEVMYKEAIAIYESEITHEPEHEYGLSRFYGNLGGVYMMAGRLNESEEMLMKALGVMERLSSQNPAAYEHYLALTYSNISGFMYFAKRFEEMGDMLKKSLSVNKRLAAQNPDTYNIYLVLCYNNLAQHYEMVGQYDEAEQTYEKLIPVCKSCADANPDAYDSQLAHKYDNIANFYERRGRTDESKQYRNLAVEIYERFAARKPGAVKDYDEFIGQSVAII